MRNTDSLRRPLQLGGYFFTEGYLKLVGNLRYYLSQDIKFVASEQSKHYD